MVADVLQHQRQGKYVKCYKKEWFYNAESLCEEMGNTLIKKKKKEKTITFFFGCTFSNLMLQYVILCSLLI